MLSINYVIIACEKKGKKFLFDQNKIKEKISELIS